MCRVLPHAPAVQADSDQSKTNGQSRDQHIIGFGQPSGEADRPEYDREQWRCTAYRGERAANVMVFSAAKAVDEARTVTAIAAETRSLVIGISPFMSRGTGVQGNRIRARQRQGSLRE